MYLNKFRPLVGMIMLVGVVGCQPTGSPAPTEELVVSEEPTLEATDQPTPTEEPTIEVVPTEGPSTEEALSLEDFMRQLAAAWDPFTRDVAAIEGMMADSVVIGDSEGLLYGPQSPAEAIGQLAADEVLTEAPDPPVDWYPVYDSIAIEINFGTELPVVYPDVEKFVWMQKSDNGAFEVLAGIGAMDDGSYRLTTVVAIPVVTYTVDAAILMDIDLYTQAFIDAVSEGDALQGFVPAEGIRETGPDGDGMFLPDGPYVITYLYFTWGGGGTQGQSASAVSNYDDVVVLMGNPYDYFPEGQQFIVIDRPQELPSVVAVIQGGPDQGGYVWTHIFVP